LQLLMPLRPKSNMELNIKVAERFLCFPTVFAHLDMISG
jgi:hypothetical protein